MNSRNHDEKRQGSKQTTSMQLKQLVKEDALECDGVKRHQGNVKTLVDKERETEHDSTPNFLYAQ